MFHVGQLVVCVDDSKQGHGPPPYVERGIIYTIRGVVTEGWDPNRGFGWAVWLYELISPIAKSGTEWGFAIERFRPVQDSALDIFRKVEKREPA